VLTGDQLAEQLWDALRADGAGRAADLLAELL